MTFQRYDSRPVTYLAHEISEEDVISKIADAHYRLRMKNGECHDFLAVAPIATGDFLLQEGGVCCHCPRETFTHHAVVAESEEDAA